MRLAKRTRTEATRRETELQDAGSKTILDGHPRHASGPPGRRSELERAAARRPVPPSFRSRTQPGRRSALIAEVKRRSPSAGAINEALDPVQLARAYAAGGAAGDLGPDRHADSSVVRWPIWRPSWARRAVPVLRKDFILDEAQILEARAAGASAVLLIARILPQAALVRLLEFACRPRTGRPGRDPQCSGNLARRGRRGPDHRGERPRSRHLHRSTPRRRGSCSRAFPPTASRWPKAAWRHARDVELAATAGADAVLIGSALASASDPAARARELSGIARHGALKRRSAGSPGPRTRRSPLGTVPGGWASFSPAARG